MVWEELYTHIALMRVQRDTESIPKVKENFAKFTLGTDSMEVKKYDSRLNVGWAGWPSVLTNTESGTQLGR